MFDVNVTFVLDNFFISYDYIISLYLNYVGSPGTKQRRILLVIGIALLLFPFSLHASRAQTSDDLADQISQQEQDLAETQEEINRLEQALSGQQSEIENLEDGLPKLEAQIEEIETQLEINKQELELARQRSEITKSKKEQLEILQKDSLKNSYKQWRIEQNNVIDFERQSSAFKFQQYGNDLTGDRNVSIETLGAEVTLLERELEDYGNLVLALEESNTELQEKKKELQDEINYYNTIIASNQANIVNLYAEQVSIEGYIGELRAEQREAAEREAEILNSTPPPPPPEPDPEPTPKPVDPDDGTEPTPDPEPKPSGGGIVIAGTGRDLYQGHGVGLSQWGAYGAAESGMSASEILGFYYQGTKIEARAANITVDGYGTMDSNTYVAGLGEVPSRACGTQAQVNERPDKYVLDNPSSVWDCWPEEAIKAQVIAARSYAIVRSPICTTAACQVYEGGTAKQWAADETKDLVIISTGSTGNGRVIEALYSSDNSQGRGTANNDTIFQTFSGDGTPYSYLRVVNDSAFARPTSWTNWGYSTRQYELDTIYKMLDFTANSHFSSASGSTKNSVRSFLNGKTSITNVRLEKDPSGRVKKVWLADQNGNEAPIGGWWFKNIWNNWTYDKGVGDYIYSQTFSISFL